MPDNKSDAYLAKLESDIDDAFLSKAMDKFFHARFVSLLTPFSLVSTKLAKRETSLEIFKKDIAPLLIEKIDALPDDQRVQWVTRTLNQYQAIPGVEQIRLFCEFYIRQKNIGFEAALTELFADDFKLLEQISVNGEIGRPHLKGTIKRFIPNPQTDQRQDVIEACSKALQMSQACSHFLWEKLEIEDSAAGIDFEDSKKLVLKEAKVKKIKEALEQENMDYSRLFYASLNQAQALFGLAYTEEKKDRYFVDELLANKEVTEVRSKASLKKMKRLIAKEVEGEHEEYTTNLVTQIIEDDGNDFTEEYRNLLMYYVISRFNNKFLTESDFLKVSSDEWLTTVSKNTITYINKYSIEHIEDKAYSFFSAKRKYEQFKREISKLLTRCEYDGTNNLIFPGISSEDLVSFIEPYLAAEILAIHPKIKLTSFFNNPNNFTQEAIASLTASIIENILEDYATPDLLKAALNLNYSTLEAVDIDVKAQALELVAMQDIENTFNQNLPKTMTSPEKLDLDEKITSLASTLIAQSEKLSDADLNDVVECLKGQAIAEAKDSNLHKGELDYAVERMLGNKDYQAHLVRLSEAYVDIKLRYKVGDTVQQYRNHNGTECHRHKLFYNSILASVKALISRAPDAYDRAIIEEQLNRVGEDINSSLAKLLFTFAQAEVVRHSSGIDSAIESVLDGITSTFDDQKSKDKIVEYMHVAVEKLFSEIPELGEQYKLAFIVEIAPSLIEKYTHKEAQYDDKLGFFRGCMLEVCQEYRLAYLDKKPYFEYKERQPATKGLEPTNSALVADTQLAKI